MIPEDAPGPARPPRHPNLRWLRNVFLAGLAAVIPILGTVWLLIFVFRVLHKVGEAIINFILSLLNAARRSIDSENLVTPDDSWSLDRFHFPGDDFLWLLIPLALLFLAGLAVTNRPGRKILHWLDLSMTRVPLFGFFYSSLKQFVDALKNLGGSKKFKGVAYVEYPSPGCRLLGFVTGNYHDPETRRDVTTVFIPTSPNPMTGFVIIMDDEKVFNSKMTMEDAGKLIISAGLVAPVSFDPASPASRTDRPPAAEV